MNKTAFLLQLERALKPLPAEERDSAMAYYREYWEDNAGRDDDQISQELGNPKVIAKQIINDYVGNNPGFTPKKGVSAGTVVLIVCLSILAAPILLPIALGAIGLAIGLGLALIAIIVSIFAVAIALLIGGIGCVIGGIVYAGSYGVYTLFVIGTGMTAVGLGILIWMGIVALCKALIGQARKNKKATKTRAATQRAASEPPFQPSSAANQNANEMIAADYIDMPSCDTKEEKDNEEK